MPELTNETARTAAILQQIADKVTPLTRFDAAGTETIIVPITAEMRYAPIRQARDIPTKR